MSRRKVAELDTPFSSVEWPSISQEDQDAILELLCTLVTPVGQHRLLHVTPSQGKRSRRRQTKKAMASASAAEPAAMKPELPDAAAKKPPAPELAAFLDVGLANITRTLAAGASDRATTSEEAPSPPYTAVFVARSGHPSAFYSHFPQMVAAASRGTSGCDTVSDGSSSVTCGPAPIRLVGFSRACEDRLSASLGIPRVSSIALRTGAPRSQGLVDFLRERVPAVTVPWLDEAQAGQHRPTQVHMADVSIGPKKKKRA